MASAVARAYSGGLWGGGGALPPVGSRGKARGGGQGALPPEADDILLLRLNFNA
jgi:hypothetical protein